MRILSICVVTMNRAKQLREALESCLACELPQNTEFVIVDNASNDETEDVVKNIFQNHEYEYKYVKNNTNVGAGAGRNQYFEIATGKYIYGMDDDAVIAYDLNPDFFVRAIKIMEDTPDIVSLATQIYDRAWGKNRLAINGPEVAEDVYKCKMFCGGSHFLNKSFYITSPYLSNVYGYEELPPSLLAWDKKKINAFCPELLAIHQPIINKWVAGEPRNDQMLLCECAVQYAVKKMMYPRLLLPLVNLAYKRRCKKHLSHIENGKSSADSIANKTIQIYHLDKRIKISTVIQLYRDFGLSVF